MDSYGDAFRQLRNLLLFILVFLATVFGWAAVGQPAAATAGFCAYQVPLFPTPAGAPDPVAGVSFDTATLGAAEWNGAGGNLATLCAEWVPTIYGTTPPGTCEPPLVFFDTDATPGENLYGCTATDTWTQLTGGGGADLTVEEADGAPSVAATSVLQFNQADGFAVIDETGGQVQVDFALPADSVAAAEMADADHGQVAWSGGVATVEGLQYGTAFPGSPATGDVFAVTDDSAAGACDSAAGSALSLCRWSGAAWVALGDGGGGVGSASASELLFNNAGSVDGVTSSSVSGADVTLGGHLVLPQVNDAATPTLGFGDGDTGFYEEADDSGFSFTSGGVRRFAWVSGGGRYIGVLGGAPWMENSAGTATNATIGPNRGDLDTGLGYSSGGGVALVDDAVTVASADQAEFTIHVEQVNSPSSQTCADDTVGASPGALTLTVSGVSYVEVTNSDPDGCDLTISETNATHGQRLEIALVSNAGGTLNIADSAGVQEVGAGCNLAIDGMATLRYGSDRWRLAGCEPTN